MHTVVQKFGVRKILFIKDASNQSKLTIKTFIMLQKIIFQINAFYSSKNP